MNKEEYKLWRQDIMGWSDDILPYYKTIASWLPSNARAMEIGTYHGRSALFMVEELARLHKTVWFAGVDIEPMPDCLKPFGTPFYRMSSLEASKLIDDKSLDFVFIDADHSYDSVLQDIKLWLPKVKEGGIIAGHDYNAEEFEVWSVYEQKYYMMPAHSGVVKAVDEVFVNKKVNHPIQSIWEYNVLWTI